MQKLYGIVTMCCVWILWLGVSTLFAQEEGRNNLFEEQKQHIMEEIYINPDFLPLVDVEKAKDKLADLATSFQQLSDQYYTWDEKREGLENEYEDVYVTLEYILSDIQHTKTLIKEALTKLTVSKKKIEELQWSVKVLKENIHTSKDDLRNYTLFLYKLNNDYASQNIAVSDIKLLVKSNNIAETLSSNNLVQMLTMKLEDLLHYLREQQATHIKQIMDLNEAKLIYQDTAKHLKTNLESFQQQKKHFNELLSYLQTSRIHADEKIGTLRQSKDELENQIGRLKQITEADRKPLLASWSKAYELLNTKDKEKWQRYLSWPVIAIQQIYYHYHDEAYLNEYRKEFDGIDIAVDQWGEIYAPAPWIVYKVHHTDDIDLNWMMIIHKYGYITMYQPLSDILVQEGDIVKRGQIIARGWGQPGTQGAWLVSQVPHLSFEVLQNGEPVDPYMAMDISIFEEEDIPQQYKIKYLSDYFDREVDLSVLSEISWSSLEERRDDWLDKYATWPYKDPSLRYDAADDTWINPIFGLCIWFAETNYKYFKSKNNIGNVGNDDSGHTVEYETPLSWVKALFNVLNNQYLWGYYTINELSRFGNHDGFIYASSPYNRQKNIMHCMSTIYDYPVQEDFPFRIEKQLTE